MRHLAILLLAACSSSKKPAPDTISLQDKCPAGDHVNTHVYEFLDDELEDADDEDAGPNHTREVIAHDAKLEKDGMKPRRASIVESETSHVLTTLCAGTVGCRAIGLYTKSGLAVALSSHRDLVMPVGYEPETWRQLTPKDDGAVVTLDGKSHVVFYGTTGRAICIVEK